MGGDPIYIKDGCRVFKCDPQETPNENGELRYDCNEDTAPSSDEASSAPFNVTQLPDETIVVRDIVVKRITHARTKMEPGAIGIDITAGNIKGISLFDMKYYKENLSKCDPSFGLPTSSSIDFGKEFGTPEFPNAVVSVDDRSVPVFTVSAASASGTVDLLTKFNSWVEKCAKESNIIEESRAVVIFYPTDENIQRKMMNKQKVKNRELDLKKEEYELNKAELAKQKKLDKMKKLADKLAAQYAAMGIYAYPLGVYDRVYRIENKGDTIETKLDENAVKARDVSITIAYLPTGNKNITALSADDGEDVVNKNLKNVKNVVAMIFGINSIPTLYNYYLQSAGFTYGADQSMEMETDEV